MTLGIGRLRNLNVDPPAGPVTLAANPTHMDVLTDMQMSLRSSCAPELIADRLSLDQMNLRHLREPPAWMTLRPPETLRNWKAVVEEELNLDEPAVRDFVALVQRSRLGYQEGCRLLAHLLKDSESSSWSSSPSRWLSSAVAEAHNALSNWEDWEPQGRRYGASGSSWSSTDPWASYSSSAAGPKRGFR